MDSCPVKKVTQCVWQSQERQVIKSQYILDNLSLIHSQRMHFSFSLSIEHSKNNSDHHVNVPIESTSHSISTRRNFKNKRQITRTALLYTLKTWNYLVIYFVTLTLWFANENFSVTVTKFDDVSMSTSTYKERNEEKRFVQPSHLQFSL